MKFSMPCDEVVVCCGARRDEVAPPSPSSARLFQTESLSRDLFGVYAKYPL